MQTAYDGLDGLKVAQQWRPDIVLLDIGLPSMNDYDVAKRVRTDPAPEWKRALLIALTC